MTPSDFSAVAPSAVRFAQQAEQDVLGADVIVAKRARLVLSQHDDLAGALGEPLEHLKATLHPGLNIQQTCKRVISMISS